MRVSIPWRHLARGHGRLHRFGPGPRALVREEGHRSHLPRTMTALTIFLENRKHVLGKGNGEGWIGCQASHSHRHTRYEQAKHIGVPRIYFFRSTTHSQCESPWSMFLVNLKVKFGFKLSVAP